MDPEEIQATEPQPTPQPEAAPSSEDAAFLQGFNDEPAAPEATPEPDPTPEPTPEPTPAPEQPQPLSAEDRIKHLEELLHQRDAKVFGTIGSLKQQIDLMRASPQQPSTAAIQLTKDKLKRLHSDWPEIAESLADDLNEALRLPTASFDPAQIEAIAEQKVSARLEQASRDYETKLLTIQHRDWRQVVLTDEFKGWAMSLPANEQETLNTTWDSGFIAEKVSEFKDWKSKAVQTKQTNQRRLEQAVTPRGNPQKPPAQSEADAFYEGFYGTRKS